eukprot:CAMPEP_0118935084 /NCGR_PEP_ID=MMETSP1169-20130426/14883_1 /TAXON_ID=36882 /ORGANISM="Pyramimonas obovata, Strain CCMP722" /LENGTH=122 /DNA_ID=CAMNT_0006878069 /DNA_START=290 /DNA_END=658 /DNA_ORIENTATION=+
MPLLFQGLGMLAQRSAVTGVAVRAATMRCGFGTTSVTKSEDSEGSEAPVEKQASDKVKAIADQIVGLTLLEADSLTETMMETLRRTRPGRLTNAVDASKYRLGNLSLALQDLHAKKEEHAST